MDDLKAFYLSIENPIDNKVKWNKLLNIYSTSSSFDQFYSQIASFSQNSSNSLYYDEEDKHNFTLMMWSIWKSLILSFSETKLNSYIEKKYFNSDVYDAIKVIRNLESMKTFDELQKPLNNPDIKKYFSKMFLEVEHDVAIFSNFEIVKDNSYHIVFNITIEALNLYKLLKIFINQCISHEIPYYIKYSEYGKTISVSIYTNIDNVKKIESVLNILKKENYAFFFYNTNNLLSGNVDEWVSIMNKENFNLEEYLKERSLVIFKSIDSIMYEYVLGHQNILVSYKGGRMNLIEYLANHVMEKVIADLLNSNIKTNSEYFLIANSQDLLNLKDYIKSRLMFNMKEILKDKLYLKDANEKVPLRLNNNKTIDIDINLFMFAIRNLTLTLMLKDNALEKAFRIRIKNECQFQKIDPDKFCFSVDFAKKIFFNEKKYDNYEKEISSIHKELEKFDNLEKLMNSEITPDIREKISSTMKDLLEIFNG